MKKNKKLTILLLAVFMLTFVFAVNASTMTFAEEKNIANNSILTHEEGSDRGYGIGSCPLGCGYQYAVYSCGSHAYSYINNCNNPCENTTDYYYSIFSCFGCKGSGNFTTHLESINHTFCGLGYSFKCPYRQ
jgi:hypothetical protein